MIPTYTTSIKQSIIENFFGSNLVIALVNRPSLGITDTPTVNEIAARQAFNMTGVFDSEIGAINLNGYARQIVTSGDINVVVVNTERSEAEITVSFTASTAAMDPFSHIVAIRNADLVNADPLINGNNRGSSVGEVIFVEPVDNPILPGSIFSIPIAATYEYTFKLIANAEVI